MPVLNQAGIPVDDHHPGGGAVREGAVRYQLFRQRIIKINGAQAKCIATNPPKGQYL